MNKKLVLNEKNKTIDTSNVSSILGNLYNSSGIKGTDVIVMDSITGKPFIRKSNKVIISGSAFTACKHFGIDPAVTLPSYNTALSLDGSVITPPENAEIVCLFAVGVDGAGPESSQILDVDYTKWCAPENLVPFRYPSVLTDITSEEKSIYFGKKTLTNYIAYYFKAFEADPIMYMQYIDGTSIDSNIYESQNTMAVQTLVELNLKISKEECREFFVATSSLAEAKINTIQLLTAWYTEKDGVKTFQNIQPLTKLNISTESLSDETKGLDIIYHIYY